MKKFFTYLLVIATVFGTLGLAITPTGAAYTASEGDLIKIASDAGVYYIDADGKRHLFSNAVTYWTWYSGTWADQGIETISQADFDALERGDNVVARAGVKLIKFKNSPKIYAVGPGGMAYPVSSINADDTLNDDVAKALYGDDYADMVVTIQTAFEGNYTIGDALTADSNLPDGSLIRYEGDDTIYYIEDGMKRAVSDDAFVANSFKDSAVMTAPSSMIYESGESITGEEAEISTVAGTGSASGGSAADGTLSVALASDTPASGLAVYNAARVPFTTISLTAGSDADVVVDSVTIERTGSASDDNFSSVALIDADTNVQIGLNQNLNSSHKANVNNDFTVPAGTTKKIILAGNIAASGTAVSGQTPSLTLAAIAVKSGTVSGSLPITGNTQSITNLTIGQATLQRGSFENSTSTTIKVGQTGYIFSSYKISADSTEGQNIKQIKYYNSGTASLSDDLGNYQLLVDNSTAIDVEFTVDGKYLTAEFSDDAVAIAKGKNKQLTLKADVLDGSTRTVKMSIYRSTDVIAEGATYGYTRTAAYSGLSSVASSPVLTSNQFTISSGTLRVESSQTVGAEDVSYGDGQTLGAFAFVVAGEPVSITQLVLTCSSTTIDSDNIDNLKLVDADTNETYWGPSSVDAADTDDTTYTSTVELPVGTTVVNVVADIESTAGFAENDTFYFEINPANITASGANTDESITASPSAAVSASTMTFKPGKLTILKDSEPTDSTVVLGSKDVLYGSWVFDATGSGEDVRITSITIGNEAGTTTNSDNLTLYDTTVTQSECSSEYPNATWSADFGCKLDPINDGTSGTSTWTLTDPMIITKNTKKTIQLRADVRTTSATYAGHVDDWFLRNEAAGTTDPITAKGVLTDNTITPTGNGFEATDGADITITGTGTLTINTSANAPGSRLMAEGQTYEINRIKLTATNETIDVTDLSICIDDGALTGTAAGNQDDITNIQVFNADDMSTAIIDSPLSAGCQAFSLAQGVLSVPTGSSGVELVMKGTTALVDNSTIYESGTANADIKVGIGGVDGIRGTGADSGSTAGETHTASTGSGMILHKSYPTVTINTPGTTLAAGAVLYDFTVNNPTDEAIAIYQLSFWMSTSSGDVAVTTGGLQAKLSSWSAFKQIAADATPSYGAANDGYNIQSQSFELYNPDSTSVTQKELQIGAGQSAQFQYMARAVTGLDGTSGESIQVSLLGDTATTTGDTAGDLANGFEGLHQGNFVWSDLHENTGSTANGATSTAQWYNGYLVDGLTSTTTVYSLSE